MGQIRMVAPSDTFKTIWLIGRNCIFSHVQELIRYNRLLSVVRRTLHGVHMAAQGLAIMSAELESCNNAFVKGIVPSAWMSKSYPSMKPLGSYVTDLLARYSTRLSNI